MSYGVLGPFGGAGLSSTCAAIVAGMSRRMPNLGIGWIEDSALRSPASPPSQRGCGGKETSLSMEAVAEIVAWGLAYLLLAAPLCLALGRFLSLSGGGAEEENTGMSSLITPRKLAPVDASPDQRPPMELPGRRAEEPLPKNRLTHKGFAISLWEVSNEASEFGQGLASLHSILSRRTPLTHRPASGVPRFPKLGVSRLQL